MKIRNGFVSNSSSSSFIIDANAHTVFEVAEEMLDIRTADDWPECPEKPMIQKARSLGVDENTPIAFKTCNYDTFIFPYQQALFVSTCNNHNFHGMSLQRADRNDYIGGGHDDLECPEIERTIFFWWPEIDLKCRPLAYDERRAMVKNGDIKEEYCSIHWMDTVQFEDDTFGCPRCTSKPSLKLVEGIERVKFNIEPRIRKGLRLR
jgi:hypothetical protein